jgi:hypothetical protein
MLLKARKCPTELLPIANRLSDGPLDYKVSVDQSHDRIRLTVLHCTKVSRKEALNFSRHDVRAADSRRPIAMFNNRFRRGREK